MVVAANRARSSSEELQTKKRCTSTVVRMTTGNVSGTIPEINHVAVARGAGAVGTGGVGAADSFGPLSWSEAVPSMLVSTVRVAGENGIHEGVW